MHQLDVAIPLQLKSQLKKGPGPACPIEGDDDISDAGIIDRLGAIRVSRLQDGLQVQQSIFVLVKLDVEGIQGVEVSQLALLLSVERLRRPEMTGLRLLRCQLFRQSAGRLFQYSLLMTGRRFVALLSRFYDSSSSGSSSSSSSSSSSFVMSG